MHQQQARSVKQFAAAERMQKRPVSSVFRPPAAGVMHRRLRMGEELQLRGCKKSSFIGSSTACIRWRAPATEKLQRSGCKSPVSPVSQPPAAGGVHQRARRVKNSSGVRRERERERKRRGKREENERGDCIAVMSFLK